VGGVLGAAALPGVPVHDWRRMCDVARPDLDVSRVVGAGKHPGCCRTAGYIDDQGLAWESLTEWIVAIHGSRLAEALALPYDDPRRDQLMDQVLGDLPDE
jgi:hypothetical protein